MGIITNIKQTELAFLFIYSAALGAVFGAFFDFFRILRRAARKADRKLPSIIIIFFQDIIFFTVAAAVSAVFFYKFNSGRVRLTSVFFMICGFFLYYYTIGRLVMIAADAIINFIYAAIWRIIRFLRFLLSPVVLLAKYLYLRVADGLRILIFRIYTKRTLSAYHKMLNKY